VRQKDGRRLAFVCLRHRGLDFIKVGKLDLLCREIDQQIDVAVRKSFRIILVNQLEMPMIGIVLERDDLHVLLIGRRPAELEANAAIFWTPARPA